MAQRDPLCAWLGVIGVRSLPYQPQATYFSDRGYHGWASRTASSSVRNLPIARRGCAIPTPLLLRPPQAAARATSSSAFCKQPEMLTGPLRRLSLRLTC